MFERDSIRRLNCTCHKYKDGELVFDYIGNRVTIELRTDGNGKNLYPVIKFNLPVTFDYHTSTTITATDLELIPTSMFSKTPESEVMSQLIGEDAGIAVLKLLEMVTEDYYISSTRLNILRTRLVAKESDDGFHRSGIMFTYNYQNKFYIILHVDGDHKFLMFTLALPWSGVPNLAITPMPTGPRDIKNFLFELAKVKSTREVVVYLTTEIVEFDNPKLKRTEAKKVEYKEYNPKTDGLLVANTTVKLVDELIQNLQAKITIDGSLKGDAEIEELSRVEGTIRLMKYLIKYREKLTGEK